MFPHVLTPAVTLALCVFAARTIDKEDAITEALHVTYMDHIELMV